MMVGCGSQETQSGATKEMPKAVSNGQVAALKNQHHIEQGLEHLRDANIAAAIKSFDEAIKQNPRDPQGYLILGETYLRIKDYNRAIDTFSAVTRVAPQNGEGFYLLAITYGVMGNKDLARQNAQKSIELFQEEKNQAKFVRSVALLNGLSKE